MEGRRSNVLYPFESCFIIPFCSFYPLSEDLFSCRLFCCVFSLLAIAFSFAFLSLSPRVVNVERGISQNIIATIFQTFSLLLVLSSTTLTLESSPRYQLSSLASNRPKLSFPFPKPKFESSISNFRIDTTISISRGLNEVEVKRCRRVG